MHTLVVGNLGYHEATITFPLLNEFHRRGIKTTRVGGDVTFFMPENYPHQIRNWVSGVDTPLKGIDLVLFLDFWNPALPLLFYSMFRDSVRVPITGLFHGSVFMVGDICSAIPGAVFLEEYLWAAFHQVVVPVDWVISDILPQSAKDRAVLAPYPMEYPIAWAQQHRTQWAWSPTVFFNARWDIDKAPRRFVEFAQKAVPSGVRCVVFGDYDERFGGGDCIDFVGRKPREEMAAMFSGGGYVWGGAWQELVSYSVSDGIAMGLTPLLETGPIYAYHCLPDEYHWATIDEAVFKVQAGKVFHRTDWANYVDQHKGNTARLAAAITSLLD